MNLFFWRTKRTKPELTREDSMGAVVFRNKEVRVARNTKGVATLFVSFSAPQWIDRIAARFGAPPNAGEAKVELDEIGTFVWDMCEGELTIREMGVRLAEKYKLTRKESEASLTTFLRSLAQRKLVAIVIRTKS